MTLSRPRRLLAAAASLALAIPLSAQAPTSVMKPSPAPAKPAAPAPTAAPTPSAAALAEGKALFARVVEWLGGPQKIASVKDVRTRGRLTAKTGDGDTTMEVQSAMAFPYHLLQEVDSPFGRVVMVVTPTSAFLASSTGTQDLPPPAAAELRKQIVRIPLNLTRNASDPKLVVSAGGRETIGGVETAALDITYGPTSVRWFVDPATGRILRTAHTGISPDGQGVQMVSDYHDYKVVEGFPVAHRLEVTSNGEKDQTLIIEEYKFNVGVDPKLFEKPPAAAQPRHPLHSPSAEPPAAPPTPGP